MRPKGHAQQATHLPQAHPLTKQTCPCPSPLQVFTPRFDCKECSAPICSPQPRHAHAGTVMPRRKPSAPHSPEPYFPVQHSSAPPMSPLGSLRSLCPMFGSAVRGSMPHSSFLTPGLPSKTLQQTLPHAPAHQAPRQSGVQAGRVADADAACAAKGTPAGAPPASAASRWLHAAHPHTGRQRRRARGSCCAAAGSTACAQGAQPLPDRLAAAALEFKPQHDRGDVVVAASAVRLIRQPLCGLLGVLHNMAAMVLSFHIEHLSVAL